MYIKAIQFALPPFVLQFTVAPFASKLVRDASFVTDDPLAGFAA
jgi:hypothetical protein